MIQKTGLSSRLNVYVFLQDDLTSVYWVEADLKAFRVLRSFPLLARLGLGQLYSEFDVMGAGVLVPFHVQVEIAVRDAE